MFYSPWHHRAEITASKVMIFHAKDDPNVPPMGKVLTHYLREWHKQTPYAQPKDFVFPSMKEGGRVPICSSVFCSDYLRPAAKVAGVTTPHGHRWGLHKLRHSLLHWS